MNKKERVKQLKAIQLEAEIKRCISPLIESINLIIDTETEVLRTRLERAEAFLQRIKRYFQATGSPRDNYWRKEIESYFNETKELTCKES